MNRTELERALRQLRLGGMAAVLETCQCRDKTPAVLPVLPTAVTSTLAGTR